MRKPSSFLFPHTIDHYTVAFTKDTSGAKTPSYTISTSGARAFVQPAGSEVVVDYAQVNKIVSHTIYLQSLTVYNAMGEEERIVYDSNNYVIKGLKNPCELDRVGRVDVEIEPS